MMNKQILPECESASAPLPSQTNPPHRLLVVEDDIAIRELNTEVLLRAGYAVDAAADGAAAWEALSNDNYDLMITDNSMPGLTGVELLKKLRAARMALPVIMATGTFPAQEFAASPWLQPAAMLLKPYTLAEMMRTVEKVLREADRTDDGAEILMSHGRTGSQIPTTGEPAGAPSPRPTHSPHRILVVDENSDLRLLYADVLAGPNCRVDAAEDGAAGWEALQANHYSLLITDHEIPKLTGVELVRKLRAAHMDLPVVMVAGELPRAELARNPRLRLAATLVKPFPVRALQDTVNNVLRATDRPREAIDQLPNGQSQPSAEGLRLR